MITWTKMEDGLHILLDGRETGLAACAPDASDSLAEAAPGVLCWTRVYPVPVTDTVMRYTTAYPMAWSMIPAVQYNGNRCLIKDYQQVRKESPINREATDTTHRTYVLGNVDDTTGEPNRVSWMRSSIPCATWSEGAGLATGMFACRENQEGAGAVYPSGDRTIHEYHYPEQDGPLPVRIGQEWVDHFRVQAPARTTFRVMLVIAHEEPAHRAYGKLLQAAWDHRYTLQAPARGMRELWDLGIDYAKLLYTEEADGFRGFSIGFHWRDGAWRKRDTQKYEIGWCGQNASFANSLLAHYLMTGDADARDMAVRVLDAWIAARRPTGLIPTHYDENLYTNGFGKTVDACNLGTAAVQLFEAAALCRLSGIERPAYTEMALRISRFAMDVMSPEGRIGKSWLEADLSPAVQEGSTGAFLTMALCEAAARTREPAWLEAAERSLRYYHRELADCGYTTAGALDVFSIDKESCIPLLKSALMLYRMTDEKQYLTMAEDAARYLSTWQWHYSRPVPEDCLLYELGFDFFGGTAVSIHGGMDEFAVCYVNDLCDLSAYTGNPVWAQRAAAIWRHGAQCISDGTLAVGGKAPRPRGSQDESAENAYGPGMNTASQWLVAWPAAFRLETLREILAPWGKYPSRVL